MNTPDWPARIIFEDERVLVVDKPPGWPSTGRTPDDLECVQGALQAHFGRPLWAPHQLDKDTSGVLLLARTKSAARELSAAFAARRVLKRYLAVVHGRLRGTHLYDESIEGKAASTWARGVAASADFSLVEVKPRTGRTHQIRIHLAAAGHPLVGERRHRAPPCELHPRCALHAAQIVVDDHEHEVPLAHDLVELCEQLGINRS